MFTLQHSVRELDVVSSTTKELAIIPKAESGAFMLKPEELLPYEPQEAGKYAYLNVQDICI